MKKQPIFLVRNCDTGEYEPGWAFGWRWQPDLLKAARSKQALLEEHPSKMTADDYRKHWEYMFSLNKEGAPSSFEIVQVVLSARKVA